VAASTPCDKDLKFDPELYKDLLAYLKGQGADGVVVLARPGSFRRFRLRSGRRSRRRRSRTEWIEHYCGAGASNFPETLELSKHAERMAQTAADCAAVYYSIRGRGAEEIYSMIFEQVKIPIIFITYRLRAACRFRMSCCIA